MQYEKDKEVSENEMIIIQEIYDENIMRDQKK